LLNMLLASIKRNPQSSSSSISHHSSLIAWMPPSIPASKPAQSWSIPHASFASSPATKRTVLAQTRRHISPTPTGLTPGNLFSPRSRPDIKARYAAHGGVPLAN
jgi:hypothetical protein